jgi:hypothetical protein
MKIKEKVITIKLTLTLKKDMTDCELAEYIEESATSQVFGKRIWQIGSYNDFFVKKIKTRKAK